MSDDKIIGYWMSVDFVKDIAFMPKGGTSSQGFIWTNGYIIHPADRTAARYIVKDIDGQKYLFMQWKSGDYVIRGERPWYYVLAK